MSQIKLVVFDMDGTIIEPRSSWAMIHEYFGTDNSEMLQMYIEHKISDKEFALKTLKDTVAYKEKARALFTKEDESDLELINKIEQEDENECVTTDDEDYYNDDDEDEYEDSEL